MENINRQIKDLEDQIRELQLEKYKIGLLNELRLDEEDLKDVKDLKVALTYKWSSSNIDEYAASIEGNLVITYLHKNKKIDIDVTYDSQQTYENRYNPYVTFELNINNEENGGVILEKLLEDYERTDEDDWHSLMQTLNKL
tara:strand:+ start:940 stop:1362 length:423 start_codon:yes stop_codon:yes gene_type:complete